MHAKDDKTAVERFFQKKLANILPGTGIKITDFGTQYNGQEYPAPVTEIKITPSSGKFKPEKLGEIIEALNSEIGNDYKFSHQNKKLSFTSIGADNGSYIAIADMNIQEIADIIDKRQHSEGLEENKNFAGRLGDKNTLRTR